MGTEEKIELASNPNTPPETINELAKDRDEYVKYNVARNPNTPIYTLNQLAKDSDEYVREAANLNLQKDSIVINAYLIAKERYVAIQGTTHIWYKRKAKKPYYVCGCFTGNRDQLIMKIMTDSSNNILFKRLAILEKLDQKYKEVFE